MGILKAGLKKCFKTRYLNVIKHRRLYSFQYKPEGGGGGGGGGRANNQIYFFVYR